MADQQKNDLWQRSLLVKVQRCITVNVEKKLKKKTQISKLMSLKHLILNHTNISDLSAALFDATPMSKLDIEGCPFTESDLRKKDFYPNWMDKRAGTINKKIQGGAEFQLMK